MRKTKLRSVIKVVENCNGQRESMFAAGQFGLAYVRGVRTVPSANSKITAFDTNDHALTWIMQLYQDPTFSQRKTLEMWEAIGEGVEKCPFVCSVVDEENLNRFWSEYPTEDLLLTPAPGTLACESIILVEQLRITLI